MLIGGAIIAGLVLVRPLFGDRWPFFAEGALGGLLVAAAAWIVRSARRVANGRVIVVGMALLGAYGLALVIPDVPDLVLSPRQVDVTVERVVANHLIPTGVRMSVRTDAGQVYDAPFFVTINADFTGPATLTVGGFSGRVVLVTPTP